MLETCPSCGYIFHHTGAMLSTGSAGLALHRCPHCVTGSHAVGSETPGWSRQTIIKLITHPETAFQESALTRLPLARILVWTITISFLSHLSILSWSSLFTDDARVLHKLTELAATPFLVLIQTFIFSLWLTIGLWMTGSFDRTELPTTMRIVALSDVALLWAVVPFVGPFIALGYKFAILGPALRQAYQASRWQLVFALTLPLLLVGLVILLLVLFFGSLAAVFALALKSLTITPF